MPRDTWRLKAYRAEWAWVRDLKTAGHTQSTLPITHLPTVTRFVRHVLRTFGGERVAQRVRVTFNNRYSTGHASAHTNDCLLTFGREAASVVLILHECAHLLAPPHDPGHGTAWMRIYLRLVSRYLGDTHAKTLRAHFIRTCPRIAPRGTEFTEDSLPAAAGWVAPPPHPGPPPRKTISPFCGVHP